MIFKGYEVLDWPEAVDSVSLSLKSKYNIIGDIWQPRELNVQHSPYSLFNITFFQEDNVDRKLLRDFFKTMQGKHNHFWVRSFKNDLKLIYDVELGSNTLYCEVGYDKLALDEHRQFLYIEGHGTLYEITSISEGYDFDLDRQTQAVAITPNAPFKLEKGCTILEYAYLVRFDTDTLSFDYNDIFTSTTNLPFREVSNKEMEALI